MTQGIWAGANFQSIGASFRSSGGDTHCVVWFGISLPLSFSFLLFSLFLPPLLFFSPSPRIFPIFPGKPRDPKTYTRSGTTTPPPTTTKPTWKDYGCATLLSLSFFSPLTHLSPLFFFLPSSVYSLFSSHTHISLLLLCPPLFPLSSLLTSSWLRRSSPQQRCLCSYFHWLGLLLWPLQG